jgi:hypothetical protein
MSHALLHLQRSRNSVSIIYLFTSFNLWLAIVRSEMNPLFMKIIIQGIKIFMGSRNLYLITNGALLSSTASSIY